ncbi:hypothetical protein CK203_025783 [Vitis vinifera]|uniref:Uncharacterized protein n=1 Tax=Vitis vinifera TaxID=29760 RepID=A0A438IHJ3_VITVI|nr:hypothetical protein CK203_025783 [Vitis vinifera]
MEMSKAQGKRTLMEEEEEDDEDTVGLGFGEDEKKKKAVTLTNKKGSGGAGSTPPSCQVDNCTVTCPSQKIPQAAQAKPCNFIGQDTAAPSPTNAHCTTAMMEPSVGVALGACRSSYHDGFSFVALFTCITALVLFHELSEFDDTKRSCRRRLADTTSGAAKVHLNLMGKAPAEREDPSSKGRTKLQQALKTPSQGRDARKVLALFTKPCSSKLLALGKFQDIGFSAATPLHLQQPRKSHFLPWCELLAAKI